MFNWSIDQGRRHILSFMHRIYVKSFPKTKFIKNYARISMVDEGHFYQNVFTAEQKFQIAFNNVLNVLDKQ